MRTNRPKHLDGFKYRGPRRYFLTFCTHERARLFANADAVAVVRTQIERAATEQQFALVAYCFMPDHLHILVEGTTKDAGSGIYSFEQLVDAVQLQRGWYSSAKAGRDDVRQECPRSGGPSSSG